MINFRYHLVSLIAVFLALALGIVVGTTALNGPITKDLRTQVDSLKTDRASLAEQVKSLQGQVGDTDKFASSFGSKVVAGMLTDQSVIVLGLPEARTDIKDAVVQQITAAGGTVAGRLQFTADYSDPKRQSDLKTLVTTPGAQPIGLTLVPTDPAGALAGALLSFVLMGVGQPTDLQQVITSLAGLHMLRDESSKTVTSAKLFAVVASKNLDGQDEVAKTQLALITQLRVRGAHIVVIGDPSTAAKGGMIARVNGDDTERSAVSTVDNADTSLGSVSAALALAGAVKSQVGHYGTSRGVDGLFPEVTK